MRPCVLIASHHGGWDVSLLGFHCLHMKRTSHLSHLSALPGAWVTVSHLHASTAFISPPSSILPCPPPHSSHPEPSSPWGRLGAIFPSAAPVPGNATWRPGGPTAKTVLGVRRRGERAAPE